MTTIQTTINAIDSATQDILNDLFIKDSYKYNKLKNEITAHASAAKNEFNVIKIIIEGYSHDNKSRLQ